MTEWGPVKLPDGSRSYGSRWPPLFPLGLIVLIAALTAVLVPLINWLLDWLTQ